MIDPAEAKTLIDALDAYQAGLYPPESNHLEPIETLRSTNVKMFGCAVDGMMAAMGAVKLMKDYGEIKRLFVAPAHRGEGLARAIMLRLEQEIERRGLTLARLETGIHQHAAIGLYEAMGYVRRGHFGDYVEDPLSVFMEKNLAEP